MFPLQMFPKHSTSLNDFHFLQRLLDYEIFSKHIFLQIILNLSFKKDSTYQHAKHQITMSCIHISISQSELNESAFTC